MVEPADTWKQILKPALQKHASDTPGAFVEEKARTELNMVKDGEHVAIIKQEGEKGSRQPGGDLLESMQRSNPRKWWNYFFH